MDKFWVVHIEGGAGISGIKHFKREDADQEAESLAKEVGRPVWVLEALSMVRVAGIVWKDLPWT